MPDALYVEDAAQAHAVLRCVQEIVTNAARHARAGQLWIRIVSDTSGIDVHAHDDGAGAGRVTWGNGLKGMRERFEAQAGGIDISTAPGQGFPDPRIHAAAGADAVIRVALIDDQTLVRRGIKALLELTGDITVVAEATDGDEGVAVIRRERPDVVLLDVRMPRKGGLDLLGELQRAGELPPTILLTTFDDDGRCLPGLRRRTRISAEGRLARTPHGCHQGAVEGRHSSDRPSLNARYGVSNISTAISTHSAHPIR
jgi:CheY-like chemotaxis protein